MRFTTLVGLGAAVGVVRASHRGELHDLVLENGSPWPTVAVLAVTLFVLAVGAPRAMRAVGVCLSGAFLVAAVDPATPDPGATLLPFTAIAGLAAVTAMVAHSSVRQLPRHRRPTTSSRQLRTAVRAHQRRTAAA